MVPGWQRFIESQQPVEQFVALQMPPHDGAKATSAPRLKPISASRSPFIDVPYGQRVLKTNELTSTQPPSGIAMNCGVI